MMEFLPAIIGGTRVGVEPHPTCCTIGELLVKLAFPHVRVGSALATSIFDEGLLEPLRDCTEFGVAHRSTSPIISETYFYEQP